MYNKKINQLFIGAALATMAPAVNAAQTPAWNGSSCGGRSAWSKAGGYSPICYKKEVTKEMVKAWRQENQ